MAVDSLITLQKNCTIGRKLTQAYIITLLMADKVRKILIPQICVDFHGWENRTCKRKMLFNLIQTSKNNIWYIKQNLQIHWIQRNEMTVD